MTAAVIVIMLLLCGAIYDKKEEREGYTTSRGTHFVP